MTELGPHSASSGKGPRLLGRVLWFGLGLLLVGFFLVYSLVPRLVEHLLRLELAAVGCPNAIVQVRQVTPWGAVIDRVALAKGNGAPGVDGLFLRFTPWGLCQRRIDRMELDLCHASLDAEADGLALAGMPAAFCRSFPLRWPALLDGWHCREIQASRIVVTLPDPRDPKAGMSLRGRGVLELVSGDLWQGQLSLAAGLGGTASFRGAVHADSGDGGFSGELALREGYDLAVLADTAARHVPGALSDPDLLGQVEAHCQGNLRAWRPESVSATIALDHAALRNAGRLLWQADRGVLGLHYRRTVAAEPERACSAVEAYGCFDKLEAGGAEASLAIPSLKFDGRWLESPASLRFRLEAACGGTLRQAGLPVRTLEFGRLLAEADGIPRESGRSWRFPAPRLAGAPLRLLQDGRSLWQTGQPPFSAARRQELAAALVRLDFYGVSTELVPATGSSPGLQWLADGAPPAFVPVQLVLDLTPGRLPASPVKIQEKGSP